VSHVVITGGNGFIGSHITALFKEKGVDIRHPDSRALDIGDLPALCAALHGADVVIHNAALVKDWGSRQRFLEINVRGTENVLAACRENGVRHVILTGSCSVFGEEHQPTVKDEQSPKNSHYPYFLDRIFPSAMNHYRDSKREAVEKAIAFARTHAMSLTVLHPVWVYGERECSSGFYEYLKAVQDGIPAGMGSPDNLFHVIYAGDLAAAYHLVYRAMLAGKLTGIREYLIGNPKPVRMDAIFRLLCAEAGLKKPPNLPKALVYPLAFACELLATLARRKTPPLLTRSRVNMFYDSIAYSTGKAARELGFSAPTPLEEGIARTVQWYRKEGWLAKISDSPSGLSV
jgi:nucleoside-diphosphate-sugar epimerase